MVTEITEVTEVTTRARWRRLPPRRVLVAGWLVLVAAGLAALVCALVPVGPDWLGGAGSVVIASTYTWALTARTGGRPVVFGFVALVLAGGSVLLDQDALLTGAAVLTCVVAAVLGVVVTVPAPGFWRAVRECVVALVVAAIGALATVGYEPAVTVGRFEYVTAGLALLGALAVVYRLGSGLHGLGRRGVVIVVVGGVVLAAFVLYAELFRRYGSATVVETLDDLVDWAQANLGASPRPAEAVIGVPALAYGCYVRSRRGHGWWICAFGAAGTSAVANSLADPMLGFVEVSLSVVYALVVGLVIGFVLIRLDILVTGSTAAPRGRRSSRRSEGATPARPEPGRAMALL